MKLRNGEERHTRDGQLEQHSIWHNLVQVYREFAKESSVHGIKYTIQANTTIERFARIVIENNE